jgi:YihY family inner membrane protein
VNVVERGVRSVDGWQQHHRVPAAAFGVIKKFGDDQGPSLAVSLTYYGFMSLFPLLLVLSTVLGFIGNESISKGVLGTTLKQFPVVGEQIGKNAAHPLTGSGPALVIGLLLLVYGALGVAQAAQHAMAQVWNVPGVARPGFVPRLIRGVAFFGGLALGMAATGALGGLITIAGQNLVVRTVGFFAAIVLNALLYLAAFRILTPSSIATRKLIAGAIVGGIGYTVLLLAGTALVQHQLRHAQALYGQFAIVLGLMGWLFLVSQLTLYAAETNVVIARHLWPRSIVQPPLTDADERVLHDIARQEERRPEERVGVGFAPDATREATADADVRRSNP